MKMEDEICSCSKYGFCKFKESCRRHHFKEDCDKGGNCENPKSCQKRHPRVCKRLNMDNFCKFGKGCAYFHPNRKEKVLDNIALKLEIEKTKRNMELMAFSIIKLEDQMKDIITQNKAYTLNNPEKESVPNKDEVKESESEEEPEINVKRPVANKKSLNNKGMAVNKNKVAKDLRKCFEFEYTCKKLITLKKHMKNNHEEHSDKVCNKVFKSHDEVFTHEDEDFSGEDIKKKKIFCTVSPFWMSLKTISMKKTLRKTTVSLMQCWTISICESQAGMVSAD